MNARDAIKASYTMPDSICRGYLSDLTDEQLMVRPVPGTNHIAWQLGHLLSAEHMFIEGICPGVMPPLPAGFAEKHNKAAAASDDPKAFCTKNEYLTVYDQVRAGSLKAIDKLTDADLEKPGPENFRSFCPTVASVLMMQPTHWMMHAGQWAVVRRKLGKPPMF
jgi:hypothetical protein